MKGLLDKIRGRCEKTLRCLYLKRLRSKAKRTARCTPGVIQLGSFHIGYADLLSTYIEYKDIFLDQIYHFEAETRNPRVIDGGSCIGMSVLYFKSIYPASEIVCFEPDENIFKILRRKVEANQLGQVELIQAGLTKEGGIQYFLPDGSDGGKVVSEKDGAIAVKTVRLSEYLQKPVDFLKLNIEGQELAVLQEVEASGRMSNIKEIALEYHGFAGKKQELGDILNLLDRNGFRYLVHDFDAETTTANKPPFKIQPDTTWFCLVYAKRLSYTRFGEEILPFRQTPHKTHRNSIGIQR